MKIGIVGSGLVGSTAAYAMVMRGVGRQIVLVDLNQERARAEADDILHAVPFAHPIHITSGGYRDLEGCRIVVITAGVSQRPGETRLELLRRNAKVFEQVIPSILEYASDAVLLIATNPVDVMTHLAEKYAKAYGVAPGRVIGTGTTLDTARFRSLLALTLGVDPNYVHGYVLGEHGDSEVLTWSLVTIGGMPLQDYCQLRGLEVCKDERIKIDEQVRKAAYTIIQGKGATYYGIGSAIARIAEVVLGDQRAILTVCTPMDEVAGVSDVTVSLPHLIGGQGNMGNLEPDLDDYELEALRSSALVIRNAIDELETYQGLD